MKKALVQILLVLFLLAPLAAKEIVVQAPAAGQALTLGAASFEIVWAKKNVSADVKIQLLRPDGSLVGGIDSNTGLFISPYKWLNVGMTSAGMAEPGDYKVRVITLNGNVWGDSGVFKLIEAGEPTSGGGGTGGKGLKKKLPIDMSGFVPPIVKLKPDLIVCKLLPEKLDINASWQVLKFRVHNIGEGDAPGTRVWIHCGNVQGGQMIRALKAGEYEEIVYEKANLHTGQTAYTYTFTVDDRGEIPESNENNNVLTGTLSTSAVDPVMCSDGKRHLIVRRK